jgi:hypothetical protein
MVTITCGEVAHKNAGKNGWATKLVLAASAAAPAIGWTTSPAASATSRSASATSTATLAHWPSFIHYQGTAQKILAIAGLNGAIRFFVISKFREAKSSRLACEFVANDLDGVRLQSGLRKPVLQLCFAGLVG